MDKSDWFRTADARGCSREEEPIEPLGALPLDRLIVALCHLEKFYLEMWRMNNAGGRR